MRTLDRMPRWAVGVAALGVGLLVGFWVPSDDDYFALRKNFRIFGAVYEELVTGYATPIDPGHLRRVGVNAMLGELDPYTTFLDAGDNADISMMTNGQYGGVGLSVGRRAGRLTVTEPVTRDGAYRQGVRAGDVIVSVAGQDAAALSSDDAKQLLRGAPGTTVTLTVERAGEPAPLTFTLTRRQIDLDNVSYRGRVGPDRRIGYVKLRRFARGTTAEVRRALRALPDDTLRGLVLDLRGNPGGLLNAAVDVAGAFLPREAVVVSTSGQLARADRTYRNERTPQRPDLPLVVLVDDRSASASEIVAGAVQDHDRGVVLGTRTYGKGLVQAIRSLPYNTSLKMTTAQYFTPDGRSIQALRTPGDSVSVPDSTARSSPASGAKGLRPDVVVPRGDTSAVQAALRRRAAFFYYANHYAATRDTLASTFAVTDAVLDDFRAWLADEDLQYPTAAERTLRALRHKLPADVYGAVREEVAALRTAVQVQKEAAFRRHAPALKDALRREIVARFADGAQVTEAMLPHDNQLAAAVDLLRDDARYEEARAGE